MYSSYSKYYFSKKKMFSSFNILFIILTTTFPVVYSDLTTDRAALLRLRSAVSGRTLQWNISNMDPCSWKGVGCDHTVNAVTELRLPGSGLSGHIPVSSIGNLAQLVTLSLRRNSLSGTLPSDLASCTKLTNIYLQENNFSGGIPDALFSLTNLVRLNLSGNTLDSEIPTEFNKLTKLRTLTMANNQLSGTLPELTSLLELAQFDISFNRLNGSIPKFFGKFSSNAFEGNLLCGSPLASCSDNDEGSKISNGVVAGIVVGSTIALLFVVLLSFFLCRKYRILPQPGATPEVLVETHSRRSKEIIIDRENKGLDVRRSDGLVFFKEGDGGFGFEDLLRASAETLGKESDFGSTYKVYLENVGEVIVVKRLKNVGISEEEFREKVEGLGMLAHENLVPLKGYYYSIEEKLLVYDYMPIGSLAAFLHDKHILSWEVRTRIAFQSARGIWHLHSLGITHGNIKPSNILLTRQFNAFVTEFSILQLLSSTYKPSSIGYHAPDHEANESRTISQQTDVYSFGVLLLELLIAKTPPTNGLDRDIKDLPSWGKSMAEGNSNLDIFDPELLTFHHIKEQIFQFLLVAVSCTAQDPKGRPSMGKVNDLLKRIHVFSKQGS